MSLPSGDVLSLYCNIMSEVKGRCSAITYLKNLSVGGEVIRYESCFLQLRMLCELIALACIVAHGDVSAIKKLRKAYAADDILKALERLRPKFYPIPCEKIEDIAVHRVMELKHLKEGFLTKSDLLRLYGVSHLILHRGTIEKLAPLKPTVNFQRISEWLSKIEKLVAYHRIALGDDSHQIWFVLNGPNGRPLANLMRGEPLFPTPR